MIAVLMFLPRFFSGGITLGFVLLTILVVGMLDLFGAIELKTRPPES